MKAMANPSAITAEFSRAKAWVQERYSLPLVASFGFHGLAALFFILAPGLFGPSRVAIGSGPGGGNNPDLIQVGLVSDLGGGVGMVKPALVPKPPPRPELDLKKASPEEVELPNAVVQRTPRPKAIDPMPIKNVAPASRPEPGAGGTGGRSPGSGGGRGGGVGVELGPGSGGDGNIWYARVVESRIGSNWVKPFGNVRVEVVYSFTVTANGSIRRIKKEKSSGNSLLDLTAERAIRASNPLPPPPPELRRQSLNFVSYFIHPPAR